VVAPTNEATFTLTPRRSKVSRYSPSVVQVMEYLMSPCSSAISRFMASVSGPMDEPSPKTSRVTPCRTSLCARPSSMSDSVAQLSMLMKPGATASPRASISTRAGSPAGSVPTATMLSPAIATSPTIGAPPLPS